MLSMSNTKLTEWQLTEIKPLELELRKAVQQAEPEVAIELAEKIQNLFPYDRKHHRLLRAKLWAFEACLDANRLTYAEAGFIGIRKLSEPNTRLYLEASSLLAVCFLRQKKYLNRRSLFMRLYRKLTTLHQTVLVISFKSD